MGSPSFILVVQSLLSDSERYVSSGKDRRGITDARAGHAALQGEGSRVRIRELVDARNRKAGSGLRRLPAFVLNRCEFRR
jgi:hypothetical protein